MSAKKRNAAVFALFAVAVIFFLTVVIVATTIGQSSNSQRDIDDGMEVTEMKVDMVWDSDRSCNVSQTVVVRFKQFRHGIYVDIPVNSGERVRDLEVSATDMSGRTVPYELMHEAGNKIVRAKIGSQNRTFAPNDKLVCTLTYDYLTPEHPDGKDILDINPIGYGWMCYINSATVKVAYPTKINASDVTAWAGDRTATFTLDENGQTVKLTTYNLSPYSGVRIKANMPEGTLTGSKDFEGKYTVAVSLIIVTLVAGLMLFAGRDKPVTPVVAFYPPYVTCKDGVKRRMLPVQMGKIIDGSCSAADVTSLIFYWASQGYLSINEKDGKTFLIKKAEIDPVTEYERRLFNDLFKKGSYNSKTGETTVNIDDLTGKFSAKIANTLTAVNREYSGRLYRPGFTGLSVGFIIAIALYAILNAVLVAFRISVGFFDIAGLVMIVPVVTAYVLGMIMVRVYFKLSPSMLKVYLSLFFVSIILLSVGVMFIVPTDVMGWTEKIVFAVCMGVSSAICPFLTRRTNEYTEMLNDVLGFRNFLRDAEKDRIEQLLADSPQYYYDILPYANVLGVTDIWQDKFKDLQLEPPAYYTGGRVSLFDIYLYTRLTTTICRSLTYVPKANRGSFSGGSFGGGGGGGSFGGFGGGGGGSW